MRASAWRCAQIWAQSGSRAQHRAALPSASRGGWAGLAAADNADRWWPGGTAVRGCRGFQAGHTAQGGAGLDGDPPGLSRNADQPPPRGDGCSCFGRNTGPSTPAATATAAGASFAAAGRAACRRPCGRPTRPASGCWWTMPGRRWRWRTAAPASCARRRWSSLCWGRRTTPTPRRPPPSQGRLWTQSLADWIGADVRTLAFLGGVPRHIMAEGTKAEQPARRGTASELV